MLEIIGGSNSFFLRCLGWEEGEAYRIFESLGKERTITPKKLQHQMRRRTDLDDISTLLEIGFGPY